MIDIMMMLGSFQFSISTASYQELSRTSVYRWGAQERFGQRDALQFTGPGEETISLAGTIYPHWKGGLGQIETLRALAEQGLPQLMVDGLGNIRGWWVIEQVDEKATEYTMFGIPQKQEFTINLRRHDDVTVQNQGS